MLDFLAENSDAIPALKNLARAPAMFAILTLITMSIAEFRLKTNLKWPCNGYDSLELNLPNTTIAIDGHFADLKNKLLNPNGL